MLKLAGEALSSHEVSAGGRAASKDACHVKSALELWSQSMCDVRIDPVVGAVAVTWVAAPAVETQAGKEIRIPFTFPRARSNDTIGKDAAKGNAGAIVDEGVGGLRWSPLKVVGLGVVQLEEQEQSVMAWKLSPDGMGDEVEEPGDVLLKEDKVVRGVILLKNLPDASEKR